LGRLRAYGLLATLAGVLTAGAIFPGSALASGTLTSSVPLIWDISCPSTALCAAVDDKGHAVLSTDPAAAIPTWSASATGLVDPDAISCADTKLCVAVDLNGTAAVSVDPTASTPTWRTASIDGPHNSAEDVSCPSTSLCVAVTRRGDVVRSTNPAAVTPTWTLVASYKHLSPFTEHLTAVSCPTTWLCVAVDSQGHAMLSTDASATKPTWSAPAAIDSRGLTGISCPSTALCAAVDDQGRAVISANPTAASPKWSAPAATGSTKLDGVSCLASAFCIASGERFGAVGEHLVGGSASNDLTVATPQWFTAPDFGDLGYPESPTSVSCASASLCVFAYGGEAAISTNPTAANAAWSAPATIDAVPAGILSLPGSPTVKGSRLTFILDCAGQDLAQVFQLNGDGALQECPGSATVETTERLARNGRRVIGVGARTPRKRLRTVTIGQTTVTRLFAGNVHTATVTVTLNATGRHLLAKFKRLPATLSVTSVASELRVPAKTVLVKRVGVTFRAKAAHRPETAHRKKAHARAD